MRTRIVHTYLKNLYEFFERECFFTHTFHHKFRPFFDSKQPFSSNNYAMNSRELLTKLFKDRYIVNKTPIDEEKIRLLESRWFVSFPQKIKWRISGKAIIELRDTNILPHIEVTKKDLADFAKINLILK